MLFITRNQEIFCMSSIVTNTTQTEIRKMKQNPVFKRAYCRINLSKANLLEGQLHTSVPLSLKKTNLIAVLAPCILIFCGTSDELIQYSVVSFNKALSTIAFNVSEFQKLQAL